MMERLNKMKRKLTEVRGQNKKRTGKYLKIRVQQNQEDNKVIKIWIGGITLLLYLLPFY